jgi:ketosteroid isomerase-like protein
MQQHKQAIIDLSLRYAQAVDRRQFARLEEIMSADCLLSGHNLRLDGSAAIIDGMRVLERYKSTFHCVHNCLIEINDGHASGEIYCTASHIYVDETGAEMKLDWGIRYLDQYRFDGTVWRISQRELVVDWRQLLPASAD